jgi:hypothetical protein
VRGNTTEQFEALKDGGSHARRVRKAKKLLEDVHTLGGPDQASEALKQDIAELVRQPDFESARVELGDKAAVTECGCPECSG